MCTYNAGLSGAQIIIEIKKTSGALFARFLFSVLSGAVSTNIQLSILGPKKFAIQC